MDKCKEALINLSREYVAAQQNTAEATLNLSSKQSNSNTDRDKLTTQLKRANQEILKLKRLLKQQLENSEKMRLETQATVETLKEEFELLVKELAIAQKKQSGSAYDMMDGQAGIFHSTLNELESKAQFQISTGISVDHLQQQQNQTNSGNNTSIEYSELYSNRRQDQN